MYGHYKLIYSLILVQYMHLGGGGAVVLALVGFADVKLYSSRYATINF